MKLEGSCHCGAVRFSLESAQPVPFLHCHCSVCRKTMGSGGYGINLGGDFGTLEVVGAEQVRVYRAKVQNPEDETPRQSSHERSFCSLCGTHLWAWHPKWPELVHPVAGAIDTPLPVPPALTHMMLEFKPDWVAVHVGPDDRECARYPQESLAEWHERHGV